MNQEDLDLLDLVPLDDLLAAVTKRFDAHFFLGFSDMDEGSRKVHRSCNGDAMLVVGHLMQSVGMICERQLSLAKEPAE